MNAFFSRPRLLALAGVFVLAGCGGADEPATTAGSPSVSVSAAAPTAAATDSTYQDLDGNALEIADFQGSKVFLNYWATWCAPCIREIPSIFRAEAELEGEGYVFLLASDEPLDVIRDFLDEQEFEGRFIKLNTYFAEQGVQAVPSTVLYGEDGEVLQTWLGSYEWDEPDMIAAIRAAGSE